MAKTSIFICGGHFSPALAVIELLKQHKNITIYYIGRKYALEGDKTLSLEYNVIRQLNIPFLVLKTGRLQRHFSWQSLISLLKIPVGFWESFLYLYRFRPQLVLSFGGYIALPVAISARIMGIPVITHEQTTVMGLTNRIIARIAEITCLSFPDTKEVPPVKKLSLTGLPVRKSILSPQNTGLTDFGNTKLPLIYVTGGSLGSRSVNYAVIDVIPELLKKYRLFHACGQSSHLIDYHRLVKIRSGLEKEKRDNYYLTSVLDYRLVGEVLKNASLVVGRSGINTVAELFFHRKNAVFIPLPWAAYKEQLFNAQLLKKAGLAEIINQSQLNGKIILKTIDLLMNKKNLPINKSLQSYFQFDGAKRLIDVIFKVLPASGGT